MTKYSIHQLNCQGRTEFEALTFPRYRALLCQGGSSILAIGARKSLKPVGLALAAGATANDQCRLLSLAVNADHRRQGLGVELLRGVESLAREQCRMLITYHSSLLPAAAAFVAMLNRAAWAPPRMVELRCCCRIRDLIAAIGTWPRVKEQLLTDRRFSFDAWTTVGRADSEAIERLSAQPTCPAFMRPAHWMGRIEPNTSLAVREGDALVGWLLTTLIEPERQNGPPMVHTLSAYIEPRLWLTGILVAALFHASRRQERVFGPGSLARFSSSPLFPGMMALMRRRIAPAAIWIDEWLQSSKAMYQAPSDAPMP